MLWKDLEPYDEPGQAVMPEHLAFYRDAIALRNGHAALRTGDIQTVLVDDHRDVWAFLREDAGESVLVVLNASSDPARVELDLGGDGWAPVFGAPDTAHFPGEKPEPGLPSSFVISGISGRAWARVR
jgi:glycosidase